MTKIYAFDFDGVLVENHKELPYFTRLAWEKTTGRKFKAKIRDIIKFRPYTNKAPDIYGLVALLEKGSKVTKNKINDIVSGDWKNAENFANAFYSGRHRMQKEETEKWLSFYTKIDFAVNLFNKLARHNKVYIVSSKDKKTISRLVKHFKMKINPKYILAKEISFDKSHHMDIIRKLENIDYKDIVFIDDAIEHLKPLAKNGIDVILASWGYTAENDVKDAKKLGIKIATKENFEKILTTEYFDVIDENDKVIGKASRDECHKKGLLHRAVHVIILNSKDEMLLQKRSMKKDLYPGRWIDAAAGHVDFGETYAETAKREMMEEIGVNVKIEELFKIRKTWNGSGKIDNELIMVYLGKSDGPFKFNKDEVEALAFYKPKDVMKMVEKEKVTPATVRIFNEIKKHPKLLKRLGLA